MRFATPTVAVFTFIPAPYSLGIAIGAALIIVGFLIFYRRKNK